MPWGQLAMRDTLKEKAKLPVRGKDCPVPILLHPLGGLRDRDFTCARVKDCREMDVP